ncbi:hypothetical protein GY45DRAFT_1261989 [Cubamyces sp. BRFM 1775]|nr:hypothetical protein GY45DRAFT_1261989 [Cubamyces sp. BRFM 1775]
MRTHQTIRDVHFTAIGLGADTSTWAAATMSVVEMRDPATSPTTAHWCITIYLPQTAMTHTVYLTGHEWTLHWEEAMEMITFMRNTPDEPSLRYFVLIRSKQEFLRLVYYCAHVKMYMYSGVIGI